MFNNNILTSYWNFISAMKAYISMTFLHFVKKASKLYAKVNKQYVKTTCIGSQFLNCFPKILKNKKIDGKKAGAELCQAWTSLS